MKRLRLHAWLPLLCLASSLIGQASGIAEPAFCEPAHFLDHEIKYDRANAPERLRVFKLGAVTLAGMAIGISEVDQVVGVATRYSRASAQRGYCTWYVGPKNEAADRAFIPRPVPIPFTLFGSDEHFADGFEAVLKDSFADDAVNFVSCAQNERYIGIGCGGQKHRGPSAVAMILGYAGCTPEHAARIVNSIWGRHGVRVGSRIAIARRGAALAARDPKASAKFRALLLQPSAK